MPAADLFVKYRPLLLTTCWLAGSLLLQGCAATAHTTTPPDTVDRGTRPAPTPAADPLLADVVKARPRIEAAPARSAASNRSDAVGSVPGEATVKADAQLANWASANEQIKFAPGFRILAYTGPSRDEAMRIRTAVIRRDPSEHDYLTYEQPTFRLKIGDYFSRLEAEQALVRWHDVIPKGLIVAEQVSVR